MAILYGTQGNQYTAQPKTNQVIILTRNGTYQTNVVTNPNQQTITKVTSSNAITTSPNFIEPTQQSILPTNVSIPVNPSPTTTNPQTYVTCNTTQTCPDGSVISVCDSCPPYSGIVSVRTGVNQNTITTSPTGTTSSGTTSPSTTTASKFSLGAIESFISKYKYYLIGIIIIIIILAFLLRKKK
jgi:hypothetical protein